MADSMKGLKRTHFCVDVTEIGNEVVVGGFVDRIRDKGGVILLFSETEQVLYSYYLTTKLIANSLIRLLHARANTFLWPRVWFVSVKVRTTS